MDHFKIALCCVTLFVQIVSFQKYKKYKDKGGREIFSINPRDEKGKRIIYTMIVLLIVILGFSLKNGEEIIEVLNDALFPTVCIIVLYASRRMEKLVIKEKGIFMDRYYYPYEKISNFELLDASKLNVLLKLTINENNDEGKYIKEYKIDKKIKKDVHDNLKYRIGK